MRRTYMHFLPAVLLAVCAISAYAQTGVADWDLAVQMHNNLRQQVGVGSLSWDDGLRKRSDAHAQQLAWREGCNLRHIGYENLSMGAPINGQSTVQIMKSGVQMWIDEGPGAYPEHGHYNAMVNSGLTRIGCSTQLGPWNGGPDCWVVMCSYA